ncbi:hypothetical protein BU15DRAFT_71870 [Melanogaster broomeanus]|nr:hypothetical protein BU15DRAFT_71870 [Melanogaster broomeanus]
MSTPTTESYTPRPSMSEPSLQSGPLPLFEQHLKVLTDSYLSFFLERKRIEEVYVDSLLKLHRRAKSIDSFLDDRTDMSTARRAWDELSTEAQTRQAFLTTLTVDVETQERTRKRIKEDIKESELYIYGLCRQLLTKAKALLSQEDYKAAAASAPPQTASNTPLFAPFDRRPSGTTHATRNRSPSTSGTAFADFAQHGKKQLNQLMTFLDKGATVKETLGVRSENSAIRAVRAKREADEADKEYRKGVHWLETLRLHTDEDTGRALKTLYMTIRLVVKSVLEKYTDNMIATTVTQTQLSEHARSMVAKISSEKDVSLLTISIPRSLTSLIPKPVLYYNYNVGECSDLIFGVSLVDYMTSRGLGETEIPKIVRICIQEVDERGLAAEGIYRVSGRHAVVQELRHKIERNEVAFKFNRPTDDIYAVSSLLKLYLRELPEPLFKYQIQDRTEYTEGRVGEPNSIAQMRSKIRRLPASHRETLRAIAEHLARVAASSEKNKMDARNLAIVFGTVVFGEDEMPKGGDILSVQHVKDTRMEDLIQNASQLFEDPVPSTSPPLPEAPVGEPIPVYNYGSSHTKIGNVPPRSQSPRHPEDFTPRLPARPTGSIHPSLRANPVSPIRSTMDILQLPGLADEEEPSPDYTHAQDNEPYIVIPQSPSPSPQSLQASSASLASSSESPIP